MKECGTLYCSMKSGEFRYCGHPTSQSKGSRHSLSIRHNGKQSHILSLGRSLSVHQSKLKRLIEVLFVNLLGQMGNVSVLIDVIIPFLQNAVRLGLLHNVGHVVLL